MQDRSCRLWPAVTELQAAVARLVAPHASITEFEELIDKMHRVCDTIDAEMLNLADLNYGRGHREGRERGYEDGWTDRDRAAQAELEAQTKQVEVLQHALAEHTVPTDAADSVEGQLLPVSRNETKH